MPNEFQQAAFNADIDKIKELLKNKQNPYTQNDFGQYPILCALELPAQYSADYKKNKQQIFSLLLPYYEHLEVYADNIGDNIMHYLAKFNYNNELNNIIKNCNDNNIFFVANKSNQLPIHLAIMNKNQRAFELLLNIPKMTTYVDKNTKNMLHHIAHYGTSDMLNYYLSLTDDISSLVNAKDIDSHTPMHKVINYNKSQDASFIRTKLLEKGAEELEGGFSPYFK